MPITSSAIKTLRKDHRRLKINQTIKGKIKAALRRVASQPNTKNLSSAFTTLDRASKKKFLHKNKAARLKSRLSKKTPVVKPRAKTKTTTKR